MRRLASILAVAALGLGAGCGSSDGEGDICSRDEDCNAADLVCVSQVLNCDGSECWGTCERECEQAADCDGGDICIWILDARVCRSADYQDP